MSTILGIISLVSMIVVVFIAGRNGGEASVSFGFTGVFALFFSLIGLVLGILTIGDKGYYRFFPVLGTILNLVTLAYLSLILYAGANL